MTYSAVVAGVLAEHGHTDVEPLVLADLTAGALHGGLSEVAAMCDRHGFVTEGYAGELAEQIVQAVREAATHG